MTDKISYTGFEVAVIGMAGKFPQAGNLNEFWENLKQGKESLSFLSEKELEEMGVDPTQVDYTNFVGAKGGVLEDREYFDAHFFGYSPREAEIMDPQLRIFHECVWEALEDAGYDPGNYSGSIGLYAGGASGFAWQALSHLSGKAFEIGQFTAWHLHDKDFLCARISFKLNLKGPSFSINTACSTSLVTVHLASRALLMGECDMALAGGVSINPQVPRGYTYQQGMILSPDGRCRAFDEKAAGTVFGNGSGVVVLKRLKYAVADGDHIYAVVIGTAINNDGIRKVGFTAPSIDGQVEVIKAVHQITRVNPETITYVEAHGTATTLGDPIEIESLKQAFNTSKKQYCGVGSVKTNIGHLDTAAGIAGFIKTVLTIHHRQIPPSLHFEKPNPKIDFKNSPFYVNAQLKEWKTTGYPLRAAISSFGIGGTNAHALLEEAPQEEERPGHRNNCLLVISARSEAALEVATKNLVTLFRQAPTISLPDAAYTLQNGRQAFNYRRILTCSNLEEAIRNLSEPGNRKVYTHHLKKEKTSFIFMFPGLGAQYENMGYLLYQTEKRFREEMDRCFEIIKNQTQWNIKQWIFPSEYQDTTSEKPEPVEMSPFEQSQLQVFTLEYAMARLLMHWGIQPHALIGYSFGEYVAATISGVFSLEHALMIMVARGRLIRTLDQGAMLSVPLNASQAENHIKDFYMNKPANPEPEISIAIDNGESTVLAGKKPDIEAFEEYMKQKKYMCIPMQGQHALHSPLMEPILEEFRGILEQAQFKAPRIPYISNVTGYWITVEDATNPEYWCNHLKHTVKFAKGMELLTREKDVSFIEVGPGRDLSTMALRFIEEDSKYRAINLIPTAPEARKEETGARYLLNKLGQLWLQGAQVNWNRYYGEEKRHRIPLPTYPFERERYWIDNQITREQVESFSQAKPEQTYTGMYYIPSWKRTRMPLHPKTIETNAFQWLIFGNDTSLEHRLIEKIKQHHQQVHYIKRETRDYVSLLKELYQKGKGPEKILYFWSVNPRESREITIETVEEAQDAVYYHLLSIAREIARLENQKKIKFIVISDQMQDIGEEEPIHPEKSLLLGPVQVIPLEYANIHCTSMDILLPKPGTEQEEKLARHLWQESQSDNRDLVIAYREHQRWVRTYEPVDVTEPGEEHLPLRTHGVYLLAGGLGDVGLTLADHLAEKVQARIVFISRRTMPALEEWDAYLEDKVADKTIKQIMTQVNALEAKGAQVLILQADITNEEQMKEAIEEVKKRFGEIHGVLHLAGIADGAIIHRRTRELSESILAPKVKGTLILESLLKEMNLDFFILFSSISSIAGAVGQVGYFSANAFLDYYAIYKNRISNTFTVAINWDRWQKMGMGILAEESYKQLTGKELPGGITAEQGVKAFHRILGDTLSQVIVTPMNLTLLNSKNNEKQRKTTKNEEKQQKESEGLYRRPQLEADYIPPQEQIQETLAEIWKVFFGIQEVGIKDDFFELGGDSLKAITVITRIHRELKVAISLVDFFNNPTIESLSAFIKSQDKRSFHSIQPVEKREYYPQSSTQRRLYMLQQMEADCIAYNEFQVLPLNMKLDLQWLERVFKELIQRHESLRTSFEIKREELVQRVHQEKEFQIEKRDSFDGFIRPFDLSKAPLMRVGYHEHSQNQSTLYFDIHHIITDARSQEILKNDVMALYAGEEPNPLKLQYKDYALWISTAEQQKQIENQKNFWLDIYPGDIPVLQLPTDFHRPAFQSFEGSTVIFTLNPAETATLRTYTKETEVTLYMFLLALFNVLLSKMSGQEDIVIGSPTAHRRHVDLENIMGMFINTLAMRNFPKAQKRFNEFLGEVKTQTLGAYENQEFQFEDLVDEISVKRDTSRNPVFDVMFNLLNPKELNDNTRWFEGPEAFEHRRGASKFDLTLTLLDFGEKQYFTFEYCTKLFSKETIDRIIGYFKGILSTVLENKEIQISEISLLTEEERNRIIKDFNQTQTDYPSHKTLQQLFEAQVKRTPDAIALIGNSVGIYTQCSYSETNNRANHWARQLRKKAAAPNNVVGILADRSIEMIIGLLSILKSGAAYLPLDPEFPARRIQYQLKDSATKIIMTHTKTNGIPEHIQKIPLDPLEDVKGKMNNPKPVALSQDLAYVTYTSGSTGMPKGVMIEHQAVVNFIKAMTDLFEFTPQSRILSLTTLSFDIFGLETILPLVKGSTVILGTSDEQVNARSTALRIQRERITIFQVTPSRLQLLLTLRESAESLKNLSYLLVGGEEFSGTLLQEARQYTQGRIFNMYGPTETTIWSTCKEVTGDRALNIGKPIANTGVYILDSLQNLQPIGVQGEILISGHGLSRGYLNKPELTHEKFCTNTSITGERLYHTGDLGRWYSDGNIEIQGRIDHQVKIRGYRVELGEIEAHLLTLHSIQNAVVIDIQAETGERDLCAYLVFEGRSPEVSELRNLLRETLPPYMIPSYFVPLREIPLTPIGKVDRNALPKPGNQVQKSTLQAPRDQKEHSLTELWAEVLNMEYQELGIDLNFFELGGHSLKATLLVNKIHQKLNKKISLAEIFKAPTIRGLAEILREAEDEQYTRIKNIEKKDYYPVSSAQQRLYVLQQMDKTSMGYNMPLTVELEGSLDLDTLGKTFGQMMERHESLRTSFLLLEGEPIQRIKENPDFLIQQFRIREPEGKSQLLEILKDFSRPFELDEAPLLRVGIIKKMDNHYILMVDMHHIISDAHTMAILIQEFLALYTGAPLKELRIQYKDYCDWQNQEKKKITLLNQANYWEAQFKGEIPAINLPIDFARPYIQVFEGDTRGFVLSTEKTLAIKQQAMEKKTTLFMFLMAIFNVWLAKLSNQQDIVVGTPIAGRDHAELDTMIGIFINTLCLRNYPYPALTFEEFLKEVRQHVVEAFENQQYQYEDLVEQLEVVRDVSRNPLFDVMFIMENMEVNPIGIPGKEMKDLKLTPFQGGNFTSKFDLTLYAKEMGDHLSFSFEYCTRLFKPETIDGFMKYFNRILENLLTEPEKQISEIQILDAEEKTNLLHTFNKTTVDYPKEKTVLDLFREQVRKTPSSVAVMGMSILGTTEIREEQLLERILMLTQYGTLTYRGLEEKAQQLSFRLQEQGVRRGSVVGFIVSRSLELMQGIFAILIAGGAYLPIGPEYPEARIKFIIKDSQVNAMLMENTRNQGKYDLPMVNLGEKNSYRKETRHSTAPEVHPQDLIYVTYTSGSTGLPKGVMLQNRSVVNFIQGITDILPFSEEDRILSLTTLSFDIFGLETLLPLTRGTRIIMGTAEEQLNALAIASTLEREQITIFQVTPSRLQLILTMEEAGKSLGQLKYLVVGGESFPLPLLEKVRQYVMGRIFNMYGPTETTIWSTLKEVTGNSELNIGKPIANTRIYILDPQGQIQPIGVQGELYIAGDGLARGYLNRVDLTDERFIPNPFRPGEYMYRTGDLARWLPDGNIDFMGRIDHQVKIRGFRIEIGEIETQLMKDDSVQEAVVVEGEKEEGQKYLCAYVVSNNGCQIAELRDRLTTVLPDYMIPAFFVEMEKIPLTPNGKIDRQSLPAPEAKSGTTFVEPKTDKEKQVAELWKEVLKIEEIGVKDNFFNLGGNSLKILQLNRKLTETFQREVPVAMMFKYLTIRSFTQFFFRDEPGKDELEQETQKTEAMDFARNMMQKSIKRFMEGKND
jgi:iturin family lipopeptide synthetase A